MLLLTHIGTPLAKRDVRVWVLVLGCSLASNVRTLAHWLLPLFSPLVAVCVTRTALAPIGALKLQGVFSFLLFSFGLRAAEHCHYITAHVTPHVTANHLQTRAFRIVLASIPDAYCISLKLQVF